MGTLFADRQSVDCLICGLYHYIRAKTSTPEIREPLVYPDNTSHRIKMQILYNNTGISFTPEVILSVFHLLFSTDRFAVFFFYDQSLKAVWSWIICLFYLACSYHTNEMIPKMRGSLKLAGVWEINKESCLLNVTLLFIYTI